MLVIVAIAPMLNKRTKIMLKDAVIYNPSVDLNHTFLSNISGSSPSFASEYAIFAPPYRVEFNADEIENNAPIEIRINPNFPKNGFAATASAFSFAAINSLRERLPTATKDTAT